MKSSARCGKVPASGRRRILRERGGRITQAGRLGWMLRGLRSGESLSDPLPGGRVPQDPSPRQRALRGRGPEVRMPSRAGSPLCCLPGGTGSQRGCQRSGSRACRAPACRPADTRPDRTFTRCQPQARSRSRRRQPVVPVTPAPSPVGSTTWPICSLVRMDRACHTDERRGDLGRGTLYVRVR